MAEKRKADRINADGGMTLFLRKSSGLVRNFSVVDGFIYGIYADSIIIAAALTYSLTWPWPRANIPLGIVMVCVCFLPMFTVYAMLTCIMPRVGGDYVWQSRTLGGFWGYILIFTPLLAGPWFYMASNVAPGSSMVAVPLLLSFSEIFESEWLYNLALRLNTRTGVWWFYFFYITFAAAVLSLGMRFYAKLQRCSFVAGIVAIGLWIVIMLLTTREQFIASFNIFMSGTFDWGDGRAYQRMIDIARDGGFEPVAYSETRALPSFLIGPVLAYTFMYIAWTGVLAGEVGGVKKLRNSVWLYLGGNLLAMVICAGFVWLLISRIGNEFFTSANFIWANTGVRAAPINPHYGIFLMAMFSNPWLWLVTALGLNAWFWIWPTNNMVMSTRVMFAMSFDRMLPDFVARVSRRWGTPLVAIGICYVGCLVMGWLYFFTGFERLTLNMPFMTAIAFAASTLAGTLFPYLKSTRNLYANSAAARLKLFGVPLITICGSLGLIYFTILFFLYITDSRYGVNDFLSTLFIAVFVLLSAMLYLGYRWRRKKEGVDVSMTYKEIPGE